MSRYWSRQLDDLAPYVAGEQPRDRRYIKLNTNENPWPPSAAVQEALRRAVTDDLRLYPDPESLALKTAIADYHRIPTDSIFVGNGSDEVLGFAFQAFFRGKAPVTFADITYSFYRVYCSLFGIEYRTFPLTDRFEIDTALIPELTGGIVIANPNAPTGVALERDRIESLLKARPDTLILIDEAYVDFGADSCIPLVADYPNLLVTQTLSKSRSLAGLRVGFAAGQPELIEGLQRVKNSFNAYPLDTLAIAGAVAAFADKAGFEESRRRVMETRAWTVAELERTGFYVVPSAANFIMASHRERRAADLYTELKARGILVRYFNSPRIDNFLRISIGTMEEMSALVDAFRELTAKTAVS